MAPVPSLAATVHQRVADALSAALPEAVSAEPLLRRSDRADFQANGMLALAKKLKGNPRELAAKVVGAMPAAEEIAGIEVSGPGFLNITVADAAITRTLAARAADDRLGVPYAERPGTTVIDYSQPNVAKEMHVGHLRSTVIGDAIVQILEHRGEKVIRRHHIGDWGTQFGMLIQYLIEHPHELDHGPGEGADGVSGEKGEAAMSRLNRLYRASRELFDSDEEFKARARDRVVLLQAGDERTLRLWHKIVDESMIYFRAVYDQLDVEVRDEDVVGESAYNDDLQQVVKDLEESGVAVRSEGALCVFFDDVKGPDGKPTPLIVQKSNGGFGYAATDLAAIRDRVGKLGADTLLYVVDARQALHFKMVFETAQRAGWLPGGAARQLAFGTVLGKDGKPFKTREGETVRLVDLLGEAVERATAVVREKAEQGGLELTEEEIAERGAQVGIGAVKYADLSTSMARDYVFDLDRMVS
ncbi:MAG TPA: arginine--tRNA ligase, partial [Streptomyces sp.]|nr:arginine--tRNA ligase [Streptomyces sp.]